MAKKSLSEKEKRQAMRRVEKKYIELGWPISRLSKREKLRRFFMDDLFEILENRPKTRLLRGESLKKLVKK